jgi:hypothetical protein
MDIWEKVIEQIKDDLNDHDETAIYAMLQQVPKDVLIAYLPEEREFIVSDN